LIIGPVGSLPGRKAAVVAVAVMLAFGPQIFADDGREPGWLGVWLSDAVDGGVQVLAVVEGGPADEGGLHSGDIIIQAGDSVVGSEDELGTILRAMSPGQPLALRLIRGGTPLDVTVPLGRRDPTSARWNVRMRPPRPERAPAPMSPGDLPGPYIYPDVSNPEAVGLEVTEITPALRVHYGAPESSGVLVTRVEAGKPAAVAGVQVGDVLVRIGDTTIRNEREVRVNLVQWNVQEPLKIQVVRGSKPVELDVAPLVQPGHPDEDLPTADPFDAATREEMMRHQIEIQIERLERRLAELKKELQRLDTTP
jgi:S1-C subfamily serine protease